LAGINPKGVEDSACAFTQTLTLLGCSEKPTVDYWQRRSFELQDKPVDISAIGTSVA
jgi:hypothetical protein